MLKKEKEKFYLSIFIFLSFSVFLAWQGVIEAKNSIDYDIAQIQEKSIILSAYNIREKTLEQNLENYNFAKNKFEAINNYFVDKNSNLPEFIGQIENIATQTSNELNIEFIDNSTVPVKNKDSKSAAGNAKMETSGGVENYILKMNLKGTFNNVRRFMALMEVMPYSSYIDSLLISASDQVYFKKSQENSSVTVDAVLTVKVFKKQNYNGQK